MCNPITRSDDDRARQSGGSERTDTADADVDVADAPPPPDPGGLPVLGNVHELASDALGFYERRSAEYGGIVRYDVFGTESYLVTDPGAIGRILVEDHDRFVKGEMPREQLGGLLGDGLFLAEGEAWREQRTAIRSAFFRERVAAYGDSMVEHAREAVDSWGTARSSTCTRRRPSTPSPSSRRACSEAISRASARPFGRRPRLSPIGST